MHICNNCGNQTEGVLDPGVQAAIDLLLAESESLDTTDIMKAAFYNAAGWLRIKWEEVKNVD